MKTLNTRTNARKLAKFLKAQGIKAVAPSSKNEQGVWDVKASVSRKRKVFTVVKGKAFSSKVNTL